MAFLLGDYADDGALLGRDKGALARNDLEREIRELQSDQVVAVSFEGIHSVSVPFADAFFVPLLAGRLAGYHDEHPFVVTEASDDVAETIAAALQLRSLSALAFTESGVTLLGGDPGLEETLRTAERLGQFSVAAFAEDQGLSQQTAHNRLTALHRRGALARRQMVPPRGGREFVYWVPQDDRTNASTGANPSQRGTRPPSQRPLRSKRADTSDSGVSRRPRAAPGRRRTPA
jgi:hypothetical protein